MKGRDLLQDNGGYGYHSSTGVYRENDVLQPEADEVLWASGYSSLWPKATRFYGLQKTRIRGWKPPQMLVARGHKVF